jgi:4a-hydroxytetrahydrobiopterin dehydratase
MLPLGRDHLRDALNQLRDWSGDAREIRRTLRLDDSEHADLTERIKIVADALQLRPDVRRLDGWTQIRLSSPDGIALTQGEVTLAARIDAACRAVLDRR